MLSCRPKASPRSAQSRAVAQRRQEEGDMRAVWLPIPLPQWCVRPPRCRHGMTDSCTVYRADAPPQAPLGLVIIRSADMVTMVATFLVRLVLCGVTWLVCVPTVCRAYRSRRCTHGTHAAVVWILRFAFWCGRWLSASLLAWGYLVVRLVDRRMGVETHWPSLAQPAGLNTTSITANSTSMSLIKQTYHAISHALVCVGCTCESSERDRARAQRPGDGARHLPRSDRHRLLRHRHLCALPLARVCVPLRRPS
jgi:hypothetical protein